MDATSERPAGDRRASQVLCQEGDGSSSIQRRSAAADSDLAAAPHRQSMTADGELCKAEFLPALAAGDIVASLAPRAAHRHGGGSSSHCSVCGGSLAARGQKSASGRLAETLKRLRISAWESPGKGSYAARRQRTRDAGPRSRPQTSPGPFACPRCPNGCSARQPEWELQARGLDEGGDQGAEWHAPSSSRTATYSA